MNRAGWLKIIAILIGASALCALIWFASPFIPTGNLNLFDNPIMRMVTIIGVVVGTVSMVVFDLQSRWRQTQQLAQMLNPGGVTVGGVNVQQTAGAVAGALGPQGQPGQPGGVQNDSAALQTRMSDALATLKKSTGAKGDYLYDLPWYVIIGPPGSGKTTALVNSGMKFPLSRGGQTPTAIAGEGGTRYCDWWFTEDAVLIDTAGRYTTQDSDAVADKSSWFSFLDLLGKNRPKQPINGVFVCISVEDILSLPAAEVRAHADAIRSRLNELHEHLKVDFPVYALFTKADLISGFMEFFGHLGEHERKVVWGATFQTADKTANMVNVIPDEFDLLIERLNHDVVDRVQEEPNPTARVQLMGFPSQVASLKQPVFDFLNWIFEPTRYHSNATLRGFYFTSGTQQGTPIDQLIGALARSFGTQDIGTAQYSGLGKSFFLHDLMTKVVFEESGWVSTNVKAVRRAFWLKTAAYSLLALLTFGAAGLWWTSYTRNTNLITETYRGVTTYKSKAAALRDETVIADHDFLRLNEPLYFLKHLPAGYAFRNEPVTLLSTFGLNQRPRLNASAETAYDVGLQRMLRPRLMFRLEEQMREQITNAGFLSEALKIYLMTAGKEPADKARVLEWWRQDFEQLFPGAANAAGRQTFLEHLQRLLELDAPEGVSAVAIDEPLVQAAQSAIGRMTVADRAYEILRSQARTDSGRDWTARRKGGQDVALVFEAANGQPLETVRVPFFYTYEGFQEAFLARIPNVADQVRQERRILGDVGQQAALAAQYDNLPQSLVERYSRDFVTVWQNELRKLRIKLLTADKPRYLSLQAAAAPTSPITQLIESIREETALTKERPKPQGGQAGSAPAAPAATPPKIILQGGAAPGEAVEAAFRAYALLVEGDRQRRPVDELNRALNEVYSALTLLNDPTQTAIGREKFNEAAKTLEVTATRFPEPFKALIQNAAASFNSDATGTTVARINSALNDQITSACQQAIGGLYPFTRNSTKEMSLQDFQAWFGPNGRLDRFYQSNLAQYMNTSGASWSWLQTNPVARQLAPGMATSFQRANEIKQAFFPGGAPGFSFAVKNLSLGPDVDFARLEINSGQLVTERPKPPAPSGFGGLFSSPPPPPPPAAPPPVVTFQWPGPVGLAKAEVNILPEVQGRPAVLSRPGTWAIFRLLEAGRVTEVGPRPSSVIVLQVSVGGREVQYQINAVTTPNPFTLPALRSFSCPVAR